MSEQIVQLAPNTWPPADRERRQVRLSGDLRNPGARLTVTGPSLAGKSWLLADLAFSIATGTDFLGMSTTVSSVLYCNFELRASCLAERFRKVRELKNIAEDVSNFHVANFERRRLSTEAFCEWLIRSARQQTLNFFVIDPIWYVLPSPKTRPTVDDFMFGSRSSPELLEIVEINVSLIDQTAIKLGASWAYAGLPVV